MSYDSTPIVVTKAINLHHLVRGIISANGHNCDLNHIDVSQVENFAQLFSGMPFTGDVSKWNVSRAKTMACMFAYNSGIPDIHS